MFPLNDPNYFHAVGKLLSILMRHIVWVGKLILPDTHTATLLLYKYQSKGGRCPIIAKKDKKVINAAFYGVRGYSLS